MFWKSAGSYNVVPILIGICLNTYIHTYMNCVGKCDYLYLWYGFTPKFPRSFETEKSASPSLKKGPNPRISRFGLDKHPEVGMTI